TYIGGRYLGTGEPSAFVWALSDELGTVRVRTNSSGAAVETDTSWPFGAYLSQVGTYSNLHFTGKYRDGETGLDYFGARFYNAALGRFLTPDWGDSPEAVPYADLSNPQSLNLYAYVQNNPVTDADTDGHCWPWCTALAGAAIGAVVGGVTEYPHEAIAHHTLDTWNGDKILHAAAGGAVAGTAIGVAGPAGGEALALGETSAAALATGGPLSVMLQGGRWSAASTEKRSPTAPRLRSTPGRA
ncbi:MAG: RHS repeat-associated core domain-containing protein, partial [Terriglobales bacterium]